MVSYLKDYIVEALYLLPGIILALSIHEFSHAYVSSRLGDPLPRASGRLSLNPVRHIDPFGLLMLFIVRFGWAKPVMIDPRFYKRKKLGMILTSLAGPAANLLTAFVMLALYFMSMLLPFLISITGVGVNVMIVVQTILEYAVFINIGLGLFNLIPISPLDGSKVLAAVLPLKYYNKVLRYERYGFLILIILLLDVPARILMAGGVPEATAQYFGLFYYLDIARTFIYNLYFDVLWPVFELIFPQLFS